MGKLTDSGTILVDGTHYPLAEYLNKLFAGVLLAQQVNTETIAATKELDDGDYQLQVLTASGSDRTVELPPEASTNHLHVIKNPSGAAYDLVIKDDSGATTYCTLDAGEWALCIPAGLVWNVIYSGALSGSSASGSLTHNSSTITTANLTCAEENVYNCTIAGLTANRNAVLPAPSAAGKQIRINILDGDATYALIIIGDTGVTINGGSAATEWSRLFIANESVTLESTSTSNWQVIDDGRIPCLGIAQRQSAQSITTSTPTKVLIDTSVANIGGIVDVTTNNRIDIRRSGRYDIRLFVSIANSLDDQEAIEAELYVDGSLVDFRRNYVSNASANQPASAELNSIISLTAAQYVGLWIWHTEGASQNTNTTYYPKIVVKEIL